MRIAREASADEELIQALQAIEDDALTVAHVKRLARRS